MTVRLRCAVMAQFENVITETADQVLIKLDKGLPDMNVLLGTVDDPQANRGTTVQGSIKFHVPLATGQYMVSVPSADYRYTFDKGYHRIVSITLEQTDKEDSHA